MKDIKDYKGKKYAIEYKSREEFEALVPLLNEVFLGWRNDQYDEKYCVNLCSDVLIEKSDLRNFIIFPASDFIGTKATRYKFEIGKWYRGSSWASIGAKCTKNDDSFYYDQYIDTKGKLVYHKGNSISISSEEWFEVPLNEIQQYLPSDHPDAIKSNKINVKDLKYPDVVHITNVKDYKKLNDIVGNFSSYRTNDTYYLIGGGSSDNEDSYKIGYNIYEFKDIKFTTTRVKKEVESLIGRYLKALVDSPQCISCMEKGDYLLITSDQKGEYNGTSWSWNHKSITINGGSTWELMPKGFDPNKTPEINYGLKKGDWVVIEKDGYGTHPTDIGLICKIVSIGSKGGAYKYTCEIDRDKTGNNDRWLNPICLRKATDDEIPKDKPVKNKEIFEKGSYIVSLETFNNDGFLFEYCYKQRENNKGLYPELTATGSTRNGWNAICASAENWRYATSEEKAEYDRLGQPFNINSLKEKPVKENNMKYKEGDIIKLLNFEYEVYNRYLNLRGAYENDAIFKELGLDKYSFQERVLGYTNHAGTFPTCKNIEEINKMIEALQVEIKHRGAELVMGDEDELLEEAKRKYPIGTRFIGLGSGIEEKSEMDPFYYSGKNIAVKSGNGVVYLRGEWAKIVEREYPEYYEYMDTGGNFTKGKIYKIKNPLNIEATWKFIDDDGTVNGFSGNNHRYFKPSTKEAFDKQNKKPMVSEYVKCVKETGWMLDDVIVGSIWKTEVYSDGHYRIVWPDGSGQTTLGKEDCFVNSTKTEYDKQNKYNHLQMGVWYKAGVSGDKYFKPIKWEVVGINMKAEIIGNYGGYEYNGIITNIDWFKGSYEVPNSEVEKYLPGYKTVDSWCVKVTEENREHVKKWRDDSGYFYNIGAYYGIDKKGNKYGCGSMDKWMNYFDKVISTDEFYTKIGVLTTPTPMEKSKLTWEKVLASNDKSAICKVSGKEYKGIISVEGSHIYFLSNEGHFNGNKPLNKKGYKCWYEMFNTGMTSALSADHYGNVVISINESSLLREIKAPKERNELSFKKNLEEPKKVRIFNESKYKDKSFNQRLELKSK